MISTRMWTIFVSLALSYLVMPAGNGAGLFFAEETLPLLFVAIFPGVGGLALWARSMLKFHSINKSVYHLGQPKDDEALGYFSGGAAVCLTFTFALLVRPLTEYGWYPWEWFRSPVFVLYVAAFVPLTFTVLALIADILRDRRIEKASRSGHVVMLSHRMRGQNHS